MLRKLSVAWLCLASCGLSLRADVVVLRDGRQVEGVIVEETATKIVIDAVISNIRHKMTILKIDVQSVTRTPVPADFFDRPKGAAPPPASPSPAPHAPADTQYYLEVPLTGPFGTDFDETGVAEVLDYARRKGIQHILFVVDSPGGTVESADRIARALAENAGSFTYHCHIKRAYSASLWVLAHCDHLYIDDDGVGGAAVAFSHDPTTGSFEVDAKFLSAKVADLSAASSRSGALHPLVIRAMMVKDATLHAVRSGNGPWEFTEHHEGPPSSDHRVLDTRETVLALTGREFVEFGLAERWPDRTELKEHSSKRVSNFGEMAMNRSKVRARDLARVAEHVSRLPALASRARAVPSAESFTDYQYEYYDTWVGNSYVSGRRLTTESARLMQTRRLLHSAAWSQVAGTVAEALHLIDKHKGAPLPSGYEELEASLLSLQREVSAHFR